MSTEEPSDLIIARRRVAVPRPEPVGIIGHGHWELIRDGLIVDEGFFDNLVTQVGDQYYGERASGVTSPPAQVTGMQLGTGTTAVAKTGAGAAVVTYITSSAVAIDGTYPQSALSGSSRRIIWRTTWAAGVATNAAIAEVVLINQAVATNSGAAASATISRALVSPTINKTASDILVITWNHDLLGASS